MQYTPHTSRLELETMLTDRSETREDKQTDPQLCLLVMRAGSREFEVRTEDG